MPPRTPAFELQNRYLDSFAPADAADSVPAPRREVGRGSGVFPDNFERRGPEP